jgi:hypothetical protein
MNVAESTHIPGKYTTALKGYDDVIEFYKGIPKSVLEQLYKIYYKYKNSVYYFHLKFFSAISYSLVMK